MNRGFEKISFPVCVTSSRAQRLVARVPVALFQCIDSALDKEAPLAQSAGKRVHGHRLQRAEKAEITPKLKRSAGPSSAGLRDLEIGQFRYAMHLCTVFSPVMIISQALPDELLAGYRGRLAVLNGLRSPHSLNAKLLSASGRARGEIDPTCALVHVGARARGQSPMAFLQAHSNFRMNCSPRSCLTGDELESTLTHTRVSNVMSTSTPELRACSDCVDEDLEENGFSYWRRSHHVPGRYLCPRHGSALHLLRHRDEILLPPDALISEGSPVSDSVLRLAGRSPFVLRYMEHLDRVVCGDLTIDPNDVAGSMRRVLIDHGERLDVRGWASRFTERLLSGFTLEWLQLTLGPCCTSAEVIMASFVRPVRYDYAPVSHTTFAVLASVAVESSKQSNQAATDD